MELETMVSPGLAELVHRATERRQQHVVGSNANWFTLMPAQISEPMADPRCADHCFYEPALQAASRSAVTWGRSRVEDLGLLEEAHRYALARMSYASMVSGVCSYEEPKVDAPSRSTLTRVPSPAIETLSDPRAALAADAEDLLGYTPLRDAVKAPSRLRRALSKLEIETLDQAAVDAYKRQMVDHYRTHAKMEQPTWRLKPLADYALPVPEYVLLKACQIKRELPEAKFYIDELAVDPFLIVSLDALPNPIYNIPSRGLDPDDAAYIDVWAEPKFEEAEL